SPNAMAVTPPARAASTVARNAASYSWLPQGCGISTVRSGSPRASACARTACIATRSKLRFSVTTSAATGTPASRSAWSAQALSLPLLHQSQAGSMAGVYARPPVEPSGRALVTGASPGVGGALALALAGRGVGGAAGRAGAAGPRARGPRLRGGGGHAATVRRGRAATRRRARRAPPRRCGARRAPPPGLRDARPAAGAGEQRRARRPLLARRGGGRRGLARGLRDERVRAGRDPAGRDRAAPARGGRRDVQP